MTAAIRRHCGVDDGSKKKTQNGLVLGRHVIPSVGVARDGHHVSLPHTDIVVVVVFILIT